MPIQNSHLISIIFHPIMAFVRCFKTYHYYVKPYLLYIIVVFKTMIAYSFAYQIGILQYMDNLQDWSGFVNGFPCEVWRHGFTACLINDCPFQYQIYKWQLVCRFNMVKSDILSKMLSCLRIICLQLPYFLRWYFTFLSNDFLFLLSAVHCQIPQKHSFICIT